MGLDSVVTLIHDYSWRAVKNWIEPIGLIHFDGSSQSQDVLEDWMTWSRWLISGARVACNERFYMMIATAAVSLEKHRLTWHADSSGAALMIGELA
jgi:hypothetical protein